MDRLLQQLVEESKRAQVRLRQEAELDSLLSRLFVKASAEHWSGRRLGRETAIPESSLRALSKGAIAPDPWMPALREAVQRLGA